MAYQALHGHIRFAWKKPVFGPAATIAEQIANDFPRLYADMLPGLRTGDVIFPIILETLVCEVFLPAFYLELRKTRNGGFGNEFSGKDCWYLPDGRSREYPFQTVLQAWLNAAGCRYADDVGKIMGSESHRKLIANWLKGKNVPYDKSIGRFVDKFEKETGRFDNAEAWKGRLVLAAAMHRLCERMDHLLQGLPYKLRGKLEEIEREAVPIDSDGILADKKTFFVARLIYRRLKETKGWQSKIAALPTAMAGKISKSATQDEINRMREKWEFDMNPGNLLMASVKEEIARLHQANNEMVVKAKSLHQRIFAVGVKEVSDLLEKRGRWLKNHRP